MALVWEHSADGRRYEVRTAGRSTRLYTNGVLHTQYHPDYVFGGGVWDLLGLPALWRADACFSGILLLGLGGGAVVRQLNELVRWERFVAVERNPVHVEVSRRFFGLEDVPAELLEVDAARWLKAYRGAKFDLVIDDLFSDQLGEAKRAVGFSRSWYTSLRRLLTDNGMLVVNFADGTDLGYRIRKIPGLNRDFERVYKLTLPAYGNAVAVFLRSGRTPEQLDKAVKALRPKRRRSRLRYQLEELRL